MTEKKAAALHALRDTLRFHQAIGIEEYPDNEDVRRFLQKVNRPEQQSRQQAGNAHVDSKTFAGIDTLAQEINDCTLCRLSRESLGRIPGKGRKGCRLMIVGDWSSQSETFSPETLLGEEEDVMLWKMMAAIDLQPGQVYLTNSLKCCPRDTTIIDGTCEESCFSFLAREIAAVKPGVICAMGDMAVRVLMGGKEPLARLRGRFGRYRYQSGGGAGMIMPTFHPRFLLHHPDMKKATWNDLQAIKRRLD